MKKNILIILLLITGISISFWGSMLNNSINLGNQKIEHSIFNNDYNQIISLVSCNPGAFYDGDKCAPCSEGYYCPGFGNPPPKLPCPTGTYSSSEMAVTCTDCDSNNYVTSDRTQCLPCNQGTYSIKGTNICTTCPDGMSTCHYDDTSAKIIPDKCTSGQYINNGSCTSCPANSSCPDGINITSCLAGEYSEPNSSTCTTCPANTSACHYDTNSKKVIADTCTSGYYNDNNTCVKLPDTCVSGDTNGCNKCDETSYVSGKTCKNCTYDFGDNL